MDAVTNFELEAQRRRETVASDRDGSWARATVSTEPVEADLAPWVVRGVQSRKPLADQRDCQPAPLARNAVG
jgi:hypothetical protein